MDHHKRFADWCKRPERISARQFGGGLKGVSSVRLVVFAAALAAAITLLIWTLLWVLLPHLFPLQFHTVEITWGNSNLLLFIVTVNTVNVLYFICSLYSLVLAYPKTPHRGRASLS